MSWTFSVSFMRDMEIKIGILSAFSRVWRETRASEVGWSELHSNLVNEKGEQQTRGREPRRDEMRLSSRMR